MLPAGVARCARQVNATLQVRCPLCAKSGHRPKSGVYRPTPGNRCRNKSPYHSRVENNSGFVLTHARPRRSAALDCRSNAELLHRVCCERGKSHEVRVRASSTFAMRSSDCEIVSRLFKTVSRKSHCSCRRWRRLFRIEAGLVSRSLGEFNGWRGIAAPLAVKAGARLVSQPPTPWAKPLSVMNGNLHHHIPVPHCGACDEARRGETLLEPSPAFVVSVPPPCNWAP